LPPLTEELILSRADAEYERTGRWPGAKSGPVAGAPGETWLAADVALRRGQRGLRGGSSLALLLADRRGDRNARSLPNLSHPEILRWADAYYARAGEWPTVESGPVTEAPGETWCAINHALVRGSRGLPGGLSLAKLWEAERGVRNRTHRPPLRRKVIVRWASAWHQRTGRWPTARSGPIPEAPGDTWATVHAALIHGRRGLLGGCSLARLLHECGKKRNHLAQTGLSFKKILAWADAHCRRTGKWPNRNSGAVAVAPGEDWKRIDDALRAGNRGLSGGSSLLRLLARKRGVRNPLQLPPLSVEAILSWVDRYVGRNGTRPQYNHGPVADAPGETWSGIDNALRYGIRGLPGGSSLAKLLRETGR
jgi:hypothetical protein